MTLKHLTMNFVGVSAKISCTMLEWLCCIVGPMWVEISFKTTIKHNPTMVVGSRLIVRTHPAPPV
jgi:hypothetical protein